MGLSKNKIKYLNSLALKKNRDKEGVFIAEGVKLVGDLLPYFDAKLIVAEDSWIEEKNPKAEEIILVDSLDEMKKISQLSTPSSVYAVFYRPKYNLNLQEFVKKQDLVLALDSIQDPGNLGTIIRIADWFGIRHILCSKTTVDIYNSKTVQSTMGALARVEVHYVDLPQILGVFKDSNFPIYGTFLDGNSIYNAKLLNCGVIVMGNEGNGISKEVANFVSHKLLIPSYPENVATSESLNVAVATAIVCSEFRRR